MNKKAILIGGSGLIGNHCLNYLLEDNYYSNIYIIVRKKIEIEHPKLKQYVIQLDKLADLSIAPNIDDAYCTLGTTIKKAGSQEEFKKVDYTYILEFARLCSKNSIKQFILVSSMGADKNSMIFYNKIKGETEDSISKIPFESASILRPSLLLGERKEFRFGEKLGEVISFALTPIFNLTLKKYKPIQARRVAEFMVQTAKSNKPNLNIYESDMMNY